MSTYFIISSEWNFMIKKHFHLVFKSSRLQIIFKIVVLKYFAIFTRRYLYWSYVLIKLQPWRPITLWKRGSNTDVFLEYCEILKKNYFEENLLTAASVLLIIKLLWASVIVGWFLLRRFVDLRVYSLLIIIY